MSGSLRWSGFATALLVASLCLLGTASARPGALDADFGVDGVAITAPAAGTREVSADMAESSDGGLIVAGSATSAPRSIVFKYLANGTPDLVFGNQGQVRTTGFGWEQVEVQADGKIVLAGAHGSKLTFARLDADGSPDPSFGPGGEVTLEASGISDLPNGVSPNASISSLNVTADGSLRAIGSFAGCDADGYVCADALMVSLEADGSPTPGFGAGGVKELEIAGAGLVSATFADGTSVLIRSEGSDPPYGGSLYATPVSASGDPGDQTDLTLRITDHTPSMPDYRGGTTVDGEGRLLFTDGTAVWRILPSGELDTAFGDGGRVVVNDLTRFNPDRPGFSITGITIDEHDRILLSGGLRGGNGGAWTGDRWASAAAVGRLKPDGAIDPSFGGGGLAPAWAGTKAGENLKGRTSIISEPGTVTVAGLGPIGDGYGFTLARLVNDEMEMPRCDGKVADYVGTPGDDRVEAHQAVVSTLGGKDRVSGGYRATVCSGAGEDSVRLELGPAKVFAGPGSDRITLGDNGDNEAHAGPGADRITGGKRPDRLFGGGGNDTILGGLRDDRLFGGGGRDRLFGQGGRDWLFGGPGVDQLKVGPTKPDPTDYLPRRQGGILRVTTLGHKAAFAYRLNFACQGDPDQRISQGSSRGIPFDPSTGKLARVTGTLGDVFADYGGFVSDIRARVRNGRITGRYRIIDNFGSSLCRTGEGPVLMKGLLKDAWVSFSAKAEHKPRQLARQ